VQTTGKSPELFETVVEDGVYLFALGMCPVLTTNGRFSKLSAWAESGYGFLSLGGSKTASTADS